MLLQVLAQRPICTLGYGDFLKPHCDSDCLYHVLCHLCIHPAHLSCIDRRDTERCKNSPEPHALKVWWKGQMC